MHLEPCVTFRLSMSEPLSGKILSTDASILPQQLEDIYAADRILNEVLKPMLMALLTTYRENP